MQMSRARLSVLAVFLVLIGCSDQPAGDSPPDVSTLPPPAQANTVSSARWYTADQVEAGFPLYQANCAECHQPDASGTADWRQQTPEGHMPPPPLNGTAHAWHHPMAILRRVIKVGGVPLGGTMPAFGDKLSDEQITQILAWIQSHWPDEIYNAWMRRNKPPAG